MPDTVVADALRFPQDEGLSASIADGHESWPSAGYLAGLANAVGEQPFVDHGLTFSNHDGAADEVDVASGRAFVHVDTVDVQSGLGGSAPPSYDRQLSDAVPIMLELPTGAANLSVVSGTLNPVWLAYALDSTVAGVEAGDIYVRHGDGESEPPHPSVQLGETNPDDPGADTRASDGPVLDAQSVTADVLEAIGTLTDAAGVDHAGELADLADVSSLQQSSDVDHDQTSNRTHAGDDLSPATIDTDGVSISNQTAFAGQTVGSTRWVKDATADSDHLAYGFVAFASVGTSNTRIVNIGSGTETPTQADILVTGTDASDAGVRFIDRVTLIPGDGTTVQYSQTRGSPASRSYTFASNGVDLAMSSGTYEVATKTEAMRVV